MDWARALVVDASVAVKWHIRAEEDYLQQADLLLSHFIAGQVKLAAPDLIQYEVASAITVATRGRNPRLSQDLGTQSIAKFLSLGLTIHAGAALIPAAYRVAQDRECAAYDALYVALAQQLSFPFITADRRLYQRIRDLPGIIWLGHYSA